MSNLTPERLALIDRISNTDPYDLNAIAFEGFGIRDLAYMLEDCFYTAMCDAQKTPALSQIDSIMLENPSYAKALATQAILESGASFNNVLVRHNNVFGMTQPNKRAHLGSGQIASMDAGNVRSFLSYDSIAMALCDRLNLDAYNDCHFQDVNQYFEEVAMNGYAEVRDYSDRLKRLYSRLFKTDDIEQTAVDSDGSPMSSIAVPLSIGTLALIFTVWMILRNK